MGAETTVSPQFSTSTIPSRRLLHKKRRESQIKQLAILFISLPLHFESSATNMQKKMQTKG